MGMHRAAAFFFVIVGACSRPAPQGFFKPPEPAPAPAPAEAAAAPEEEPSNVPTDLPPFGAAAGADPSKAAELLQEVEMMAMDAGGESFEPGDENWNKVLLAVKTDPGSARARVAVAQMVNDDAFTVAQLEPLTTAAGCSDCADALLNIDVEAWPAAAPVVAKVAVSPQRAATDAIRAFVADGDKALVASYFKGKKVTITTECLSCELSGEGDDRGGTRKSTGAKALALLVGLHQDENLYAMGSWYCAKDCCTATEAFYGTPNGNTFLSSLCFAPGTVTVTAMTLID